MLLSLPSNTVVVNGAFASLASKVLRPQPNSYLRSRLHAYLLRTSVLRASPSTSSATRMSGFLFWLASSRAGISDCTVEIFFSEKSTSASWYSTLAPENTIYEMVSFLTEARNISFLTAMPCDFRILKTYEPYNKTGESSKSPSFSLCYFIVFISLFLPLQCSSWCRMCSSFSNMLPCKTLHSNMGHNNID